MQLNLIKLIVQLEEVEEMKKKQEQKNDFFHIEMILGNGTQKIKDQNYGISLMGSIFKVSIFVHFQLVIGLKWMFGST